MILMFNVFVVSFLLNKKVVREPEEANRNENKNSALEHHVMCMSQRKRPKWWYLMCNVSGWYKRLHFWLKNKAIFSKSS